MKIHGDFRFIQKVIVFYNSKFLIIQRSNFDKNAPNKWDLPGGNIEWGEKPKDSIIREVHEETGITIKSITPVVVTSITKEKLYAVAVIYKSTTEDFSVDLSTEHQNYKWISLEDYFHYDIQPWIKEKLAEILS